MIPELVRSLERDQGHSAAANGERTPNAIAITDVRSFARTPTAKAFSVHGKEIRGDGPIMAMLREEKGRREKGREGNPKEVQEMLPSKLPPFLKTQGSCGLE